MNDYDILKEIRFGFLGSYPVAGMGEPWVAKIEKTHGLLKEMGIGGILTLTEDDLYGPLHQKAGFLQHHEPIDDTLPPSMEGMDRALSFMNQCLNQALGVAVHCLEGRGRTGTVLGAWLGIRESLDPENAVKRIYELRQHTLLTPAQKQFLHEYLDSRRTR
jgi:atypical dual specificity phosphatase